MQETNLSNEDFRLARRNRQRTEGMKRNHLAWALIFVAMWMLLHPPGSDASEQVAPDGQAAVDFEGKQLDGGTFRLSEFRGQWVLRDFWATYCAACYKEFPNLKVLNELIPDLEVVGVAADYDRRLVERVVAAQGLRWRQVHDDDASVRDLFQVNAFPGSILVAPDGTIAAKGLRGARLASEFEAVMLAWEDRQVDAALSPSGQ